MFFFIIVAIIVIVVIAVVGGIIFAIVKRISDTANNVTSTVNRAINTAQSISLATTGTSNIGEGIQRTNFERSSTPRSVSDLSSLILPKLAKDFPEFNNTEMTKRASNVLTSYLFALDEADPEQLSEGNEDLRNKLTMQVKINKDKGYDEHFERMAVHKCVLHKYDKTDGKCSIVYQASIQYIHYITAGETIKTGRKDLMTQAKYNIEMVYIQDRDQVNKYSDLSLGSRCPHCGGQIKNLGDKKCPYCDSDVEIVNIYAWSFSDVSEIK